MSSHADSSDGADVDDSAWLLDKQRSAAAKQFRKRMRSCDTDIDKYKLCLSKRNQLLNEQNQMEIEFACYEEAFSESSIYKASKTQALWQGFTATAAKGLKSRNRFMNELRTVTRHWGEDFIQHYSLRERGINFAIHLAAAAKTHSDWKAEALPRFQQLVSRRIQLAKHGRHRFVHALERIDLINANSWTTCDPFVKKKDPEAIPLPLETLRQDQLPEGYGFDQYGLLVPQTSAVSSSGRVSGINKQSIGGKESPTAHNTDGTGTLDENPEAVSMHEVGGATTADSSDEVRAPHEGSAAEDAAEDADDQATCQVRGNLSASGAAKDDTPVRRSLRGRATSLNRHGLSGLTNSVSGSRGGKTRSSRENRTREKKTIASQSTQHRLDMEQLRLLTSKLPYTLASVPTTSMAISAVPIKRQRAASLPADTPRFHASKRHRVDWPSVESDADCSHDHRARPVCNWGFDEENMSQAISELCRSADMASNSRGSDAAKVLLPILRRCKHPVTDERNGLLDLQLLTGLEAKALLESTSPEVPLVTERQQHFQWQNPSRPIPEFLEWIEDHDQAVSVQIPSRDANECSYEQRSIRQVYARFLAARETDDPWNVLDLSCPLPSTLPDFLIGRNCQLLAQVRNMVLNRGSAERTVASRDDWDEWRDIERWALLSEGGHCTAPHMDSHGLATWITVQEGLFGFVWMSRPTTQQRREWMEDPDHYDERQQWRYWILKPGQTIFFPSGTIHGVFRVRQSQTFGLGGHILQWTGIDQWMDITSAQVDFPDSTNEDMSDAWKWVPVITDLLQKRAERIGI